MNAGASGSSADQCRILAVDDEPALLHFYDRSLSAIGYTVVTAENAEEALEALRNGSFDVILTDLWMPGMNGLELLRSIRLQDLDVPVIVTTAAPGLESALGAIEQGVLRYLVKPVPAVLLRDTVRQAAALHRLTRLRRQAMLLMEKGKPGPDDPVGANALFARVLAGSTLVYQCVVDVVTGAAIGYEALLRTHDPVIQSPMQLIELGEETGRLAELGRRVRDLAGAAAARLPAGTSLLVNLHPRDLMDEEMYAPAAPLSGVASRVVLEITERSLFDEIPGARGRVERLRKLGFRLAVDDLGAGYAGLNSWAQLEPDLVKLDMTLVRGLQAAPIRRALVKAMIDACRELNVLLIAEGVEEVEERDVLRGLGCTLMQGYLFGRPGPAFPTPILG